MNIVNEAYADLIRRSARRGVSVAGDCGLITIVLKNE